MVRRGLVPSRHAAQQAVAAGQVTIDGAPADKPARLVTAHQAVRLLADRPRFVSRAGTKLALALDDFGLDPAGLRCLDAGASTGGFTDCLLQRGAAAVVAVDVGTGQLHRRLLAHPRVTSLERTDVRTLTPASVGGPVDLVVADLSFISLRLVLPALSSLLTPGQPLVTLVKPQFEAGRVAVARGQGIIRDPAVWRRVLAEVVVSADDLGMGMQGATVSGITGAGGNVEFVIWLSSNDGRSRPARVAPEVVLDAVVATAASRAEGRS